jgi:hypothetical protein
MQFFPPVISSTLWLLLPARTGMLGVSSFVLTGTKIFDLTYQPE